MMERSSRVVVVIYGDAYKGSGRHIANSA